MEYVTWIRNTAIPFLSPNIGISWPHGMGLMGYPHFSSFASCWIIATRGGKLIRNDLFIYHWLFLTWLYRKWLKWSFIDDLSIIIEDGDFRLNIIKLRNDQKMPSFPLQNPSPQQECQIQAPRQLSWSSPHSARDATAFHHRFVEIHHEQCHAPYKKQPESALKGFWYRTCSNIWVFRNRCEVYQRDCVPRVGPDIPQGKTGFCLDQVVRFEPQMRVRAFQRTTSTELWDVTPTWYVPGMGHFLETHEPEIGQSWSFKGLLTDMEPVGRDFEVSWFWCLHLESLVVRELCPLTEWTCYHYNHWIIVFSTQEARAMKPASTLAKFVDLN